MCLTTDAFPNLNQCLKDNIIPIQESGHLNFINREDKLASLKLAGGTKYKVVLNGNLITTYDNTIDLSLSRI